MEQSKFGKQDLCRKEFKIMHKWCIDAMEIVSQGWCLKSPWYHCREAIGHRNQSDGVEEE